MSDSRALDLVQRLIAQPSVTPFDADCQNIIRQELSPYGFKFVDLGTEDTKNLWATRGPGTNSAPHFVFAGHTDVVPPGELHSWTNDPYQPTIRDGKLYGRGVADMKGGIAAMIVAVQDFLTQNSNYPGTISFLITSDEEVGAPNGMQHALAQLTKDSMHIDWCIVGEPVSQKTLGDTMKLGSRGSLHGEIVFIGVQGHVGYPQRAKNPAHLTLPAIAALTQEQWDQETADFPATSLQITRLHADSGATNVIPETITCRFNLRFSPNVTPEQIKSRITQILDTQQPLPYTITWNQSGVPYLSKRGKLTEVACAVVREMLNNEPLVRSIGGTSDARFIVPALGCETIELGLLDTTIHAVDEHVACVDLEKLTLVYKEILDRLLLG